LERCVPIVSNAEALSRREREVLEKLLELRSARVDELSKILGLPQSTLFSIAELLKSRGFVDVIESEEIELRTSEEGASYIEKGLPEEQLAKTLEERGGECLARELAELLGPDVFRIAMSWARRRGWIRVEHGKVILSRWNPLNKHRELLRMFVEPKRVPPQFLEDPVVKELLSRGLLSMSRRRIVEIKLREDSLEKIRNALQRGEAVTHLTSELIKSGRWRHVELKPYNVEALPPTRWPGRKHFFNEFIELVREVMLSLGFEEIRDDIAVPELWNFDVLFQPQDHPARDVTDIFYLPGRARLDEWLEVVQRVKSLHEGMDPESRGWGYSWSLDKASMIVLRSHTTAATIRYLYKHPEPPVRAFCIGRVFRRDRIDATHLPEFTNFDGIVMERGFSFRKLLGVLTQILRNLGFERVRFRPAYFPFTEPSVEGLVYIEGLGWVEVFGAGMFRPEVLKAVGAKAPTGAWGMGLERLAMALLRLNDIRDLYSRDVEFLRRFPYVRW